MSQDEQKSKKKSGAFIDQRDIILHRQNKQLEDAIAVGREAEQQAIDIKVNLEAQTAKTMKINDNLVQMRENDLKQAEQTANKIEENRNNCVLF